VFVAAIATEVTAIGTSVLLNNPPICPEQGLVDGGGAAGNRAFSAISNLTVGVAAFNALSTGFGVILSRSASLTRI
jgi:hypothetical protein